MWSATRTSTISGTDWRASASPEDLREYDAFGPWIDPITSEETMPRRFRAHYDEHAGARFLLKVPRPVDRAQARPGQDLFAAVLAVHADRLCLLQIAGDEVARRSAALDDVVAVGTHANLLMGRWSVLLADGGRIDLPFNTVSEERLAEVAHFISERHGDAPRLEPPAPAVAVSDQHFRSLLLSLGRMHQPPVVPVYDEPRNRWCRDERGRPRLTTGLMLVDTPRELVVVHRGGPLHPLRRPGYAVDVLSVPYRSLTSFAVERPASDRPGPTRLVLVAGRQVIRQPCLERPEAALATLRARGVPEAL